MTTNKIVKAGLLYYAGIESQAYCGNHTTKLVTSPDQAMGLDDSAAETVAAYLAKALAPTVITIMEHKR